MAKKETKYLSIEEWALSSFPEIDEAGVDLSRGSKFYNEQYEQYRQYCQNNGFEPEG
ncbi:hypothetical protein [Gottfriedia acidiceleris]|uniref:hypothetical protein n=1 Tax=Gottfriedia acidiceleris TaxID=371036 RepID=UPI003000C250